MGLPRDGERISKSSGLTFQLDPASAGPADKVVGIFFKATMAHGAHSIFPNALPAGVEVLPENARRLRRIVVASAGRMAEELHQGSPKPSMRGKIHSPRPGTDSREKMDDGVSIFVRDRGTKRHLPHIENDGRIETKDSPPFSLFAPCHKESSPEPRDIESDIAERPIGKCQASRGLAHDEGLDATKLPVKNRKR